jgi:rhamnose transport system permease protein
LLLTINRALPVLGVPDFWQRAVVGVLIIGAIVLDRILALRQSRKLVEARDTAPAVVELPVTSDGRQPDRG